MHIYIYNMHACAIDSQREFTIIFCSISPSPPLHPSLPSPPLPPLSSPPSPPSPPSLPPSLPPSPLSPPLPPSLPQFYRCSVKGVSLPMVILLVMGNVTYSLGIFLYSVDGYFLIQKLPWIVGSFGTLFFDLTVSVQWMLYVQCMCAVLLCLVCLFDLACFFLSSHFSFKNMYICVYIII